VTPERFMRALRRRTTGDEEQAAYGFTVPTRLHSSGRSVLHTCGDCGQSVLFENARGEHAVAVEGELFYGPCPARTA